jgi:hypothetical protein
MIQALIGLALISTMNPDVGTAGFNYLKVTPTAREAAMGKVALGFSDNAFGIWYNPAGISGARGAQLGVGYISYVAGVQSGTVAFVKPLKSLTWGVGGYYLNSGSMKRTSDNPSPSEDLGTFGASYLDLDFAGSAKLMPALSVGAGIKALYGGIDSFWTMGVAADLGVAYQTPGANWKVSAVGRNLGLTVKPFQPAAPVVVRDKLPGEIAVGVGFTPTSALLLGLDLVKPMDNNLEVRFGLEGWIHQYVCLRAGYTSAGSDLAAKGGWDFLGGLSAGLGVRFHKFELDYSYTPMVILDNAHRISFRYTL